MVTIHSERLPKEERVSSKKTIDRLFNGGKSHSMSAFPLRVVYMLMTEDGSQRLPKTQLLVSVPKKCFKQAVKRNRVKRQIREAYRRNRRFVADKMEDGKSMVMAFIWLDDKLQSSEIVTRKVVNLLQRIGEKL